MLQANLFGAFRGNPATQIIRQRRVNPIAALAENLDLAAGRQRQNAVRIVRRRQTRVRACRSYDRQTSSIFCAT